MAAATAAAAVCGLRSCAKSDHKNELDAYKTKRFLDILQFSGVRTSGRPASKRIVPDPGSGKGTFFYFFINPPGKIYKSKKIVRN